MANRVSFLDLTKAKTTGWSPAEFAYNLNLWGDKSKAQLHNLIIHGLDKTKYETSVVWSFILLPPDFSPFHKVHKQKMIRIFLKGYTIRDQINTIIEEIIGDRDDVVVSFAEIFKLAKERFMIPDQHGNDLIRTILYNLDPKWIPALEDKNFHTSHIEKDDLHGELPLLPSTHNEVFKAGFEPDTVVGDEIIW